MRLLDTLRTRWLKHVTHGANRRLVIEIGETRFEGLLSLLKSSFLPLADDARLQKCVIPSSRRDRM